MEQEKKETPIIKKKPTFITMKDLNPGTRVTMHLKVEKVDITRERLRYEGTKNISADCLVGDKFGCSVLVAKDNQLDIIKAGA